MSSTTPRPTARTLAKNPCHLLAFGFGTGLTPGSPGTAGTLLGLALYLPMQGLPPAGYLALTLALFIIGVGVCGRSSRLLGVHDHRGIVWDEVVGYLVTMSAVPNGLKWALAGFVLFRIFDIIKPWPVRVIDRRLGGGLGIMLDDVAAGLYAAAALALVGWLTL